MQSNLDQYVWTEKYRPNTIDDCILPSNIKDAVKGYVKDGRCPTLLFSGGAGIGKTTLAKALSNDLGADFMYINASMERGIDTIRTQIMQFASTVSFSDSKKITLLDEADSLTPEAQKSLRAFIEEFSSNHSIIMTCNFKHKLIEPLHSRSHVIDFKITNSDKPKLAAQFFKRVSHILDAEKVTYDKQVVASVVQEFFPDFRRCLNELQKFAKQSNGNIDSSILVLFSTENFDSLIKTLKDKKFNEMRRWLVQNADMDQHRLFREFYVSASEKMQPKSIPALILLLGEYQYKSSFVVDQEINTAAFLTELMTDTSIEWK